MPVEITCREREIIGEALQAALSRSLKYPSWSDWLWHPWRSYRLWRRVRAFYRAAEATRQFTALKMNEESIYQRIFDPVKLDDQTKEEIIKNGWKEAGDDHTPIV